MWFAPSFGLFVLQLTNEQKASFHLRSPLCKCQAVDQKCFGIMRFSVHQEIEMCIVVK